MPSDGSVAPKERVNIVYKTEVGGAKEEKELPFKTLVMGDFTQRTDSRPLELRKPVSVDKDNFNDVLASQELSLRLSVRDELSGGGNELPVELRFASIKDFEPEQVARQVPELSKLLELREALIALKGPLGNIPAFRRKIQALIGDEQARAALLAELAGGSAAKP